MMDDIRQLVEWLWRWHRGCLAGALLGAVLGIAILIFGVFPVLFVILCIGAGVWLGRKVDNNDEDWLERFREWKTSEYRRWK